jgi:hypothetical protein
LFLFRLLVGIAILTMGRRLFWLFLGGTGFVLGFEVAERTFHGQPHSVLLVIALIAGVIGALLAVFLQKLAIVAGGFFAGGYLLTVLLQELGVRNGQYHWFLFIIGGIIGAILMQVLFGWTLIILSSVMGSVLILQALHFGPQITKLIFVLLLALGIAIQYGLFRQKPHPL